MSKKRDKDELIFPTKEEMDKKLNLVLSALFMVAGVSFLAWTIYDVFFK